MSNRQTGHQGRQQADRETAAAIAVPPATPGAWTTSGPSSTAEMLDRLRRIFDEVGARSVALLLGDVDIVGGARRLGPDDGEVLAEVARRIRASVGARGILARLDGDEFAAVLVNPAPGESVAVARRLVEAVRAPMIAAHGRYEVGLSIGVALGRVDHERPEALLHDADVALGRAKAAGPRRVAVYDVGSTASGLGHREIVAGLHGAADRGELWIAYQPRVRLSDGVITGLEALLRWDHPTQGPLSPGAFLTVAAERGMMAPLGEWVLSEACRQLALWRTTHACAMGVVVGVNLSGQELRSDGIIAAVARAVDTSGIPAECLELEASQRLLSIESTAGRLRELKHLGARIAVDDFGTGYAWLAELRRLPVDVLKVDGLVVQRLHRARADRDLVRLAVGLADALGVEAVAEGVERVDTLLALGELGYRSAQGTILTPPLPPEAISRILADGGHVTLP